MATSKDNIAAMKEAAFDHIAGIGKTEGAGARARVDLAEYVCLQAHEGVFEPDDATEAWTRMSEASLKEVDELGGSEQTFRQRVSDIRHFIILGNNKDIDGPALLRDFTLFSSRASVSSGIEVDANEIIVLGNSPYWSGNLQIAHRPMADALDIGAVVATLGDLGIEAAPQVASRDCSRLHAVFVKC